MEAVAARGTIVFWRKRESLEVVGQHMLILLRKLGWEAPGRSGACDEETTCLQQ